jgi:hypothetical protein
LVTAPLVLSGPAFAGGPTSALLSVPGEGATASLYYTDPEYDALADLVGIETSDGVGKVDGSGLGHENGPGVTVTWLIHDVTPWRVDRIYLEGKGAPWISTQVSSGGGMSWDSPVVWHQPASASELVTLLDRLGVGEAARGTGDVSGVAGAPLPIPAEQAPIPAEPAPVPVEPASEEPVRAEASSYTGLVWGLGGLGAGVLLTALWVRRSRAGADASTEPGNQDNEAPGTLAAEELAWPAPRS